ATRQAVLGDWKRSVGQLLLLSVQVSATSHAPAAARQTVPALPGLCTHAGVPTVPLHTSVVQTMPSSVHAVPAALTKSVGQLGLEPVQVSRRSHSFAAARQTVPALPAACWQLTFVPSHVSVVQMLPSSVPAVPAALTRSVGQLGLEPVQISWTSHSFAAARQMAPGFPAACWQVTWVPSHVSVVHGFPSSVHAVPVA